MSTRIFKSIFFIAVAVAIACFGLFLGALYGNLTGEYISELHREADYVAQGVRYSGIDYFSGLHVDGDQRLTYIASDGTVLYDNREDVSTLGNHANREEVAEAMEYGRGESVRYSSTRKEETVNCAVRLDDGTVVRISGTRYTVLSLMENMIQPLVLVMITALALSALLASRIAKSIVKPINEFDFTDPGGTAPYREMSSFADRIKSQNMEIRRRMDELDRARKEFGQITENITEGLIVTDVHGAVISKNPAATRIFGNGSDGDPVLREAVNEALQGRRCEKQLKIDDRMYALHVNPVRDGDTVAGAAAVSLDVTEETEREKLRREFTANVSHELKTPLTSISGFAEIIENGMAKPEDVSRFAGNIRKEAARLIALVGDIIKLSQLDENQIATQREDVDLYDLAGEIIARLEPAAKQNQIEISLNGMHAHIDGVRQILYEMIYNLCDNGVKYNKPGGRVGVNVWIAEDRPRVRVADTGIGIPVSQQKRVFERFFRVDKSHSKEVGGTGLGLSIVKHGAAFHGANVKLESAVGEGTAVTIEF